MIKIDLHVHSKYSYDSISDPKKIIKVAKMKGLNGVAITDHNTIKGGIEAAKYASDDFIVIIGSEIRTKSGEIVGLFLNEEISSGLDIVETIKKIHEQKGIAIIPHPFDTFRKYAVQYIDTELLKMIDCIEVLNGRSNQTVNINAKLFSERNKKKMTAGSDAHTLLEIGNAGIILDNDSLNKEDLKKVLLKSKVRLYQNPPSYLSYRFIRLFDKIGKFLKQKEINKEIIYKIINDIQVDIWFE